MQLWEVANWAIPLESCQLEKYPLEVDALESTFLFINRNRVGSGEKMTPPLPTAYLGDSGSHEAARRNIKLGREDIASNHLQPREGIINIASKTWK